MSQELLILTLTTISIAFFHTLLGPDHYLPFIIMSRARKWSFRKTSWITFLCGLGHILSSVMIAILVILLGISIQKLDIIESVRGDIAAWALISFGLIYFIWGVRKAIKNKAHAHDHAHQDGTIHTHKHIHQKSHSHIHKDKNITSWILFIIFFLGPCEPLIPILLYPSLNQGFYSIMLLVGIFGIITILTMLGIVLISSFSINLIPLKKLEKYSHALAGFIILLCGIAIQFLGL